MYLRLKGKNAIIIGASRGKGKSIALNLAEEGANVAICARGYEDLKSTEKELLEKGVKVIAQICDAKETVQLESFIDYVKKEFGSIDILINNTS